MRYAYVLSRGRSRRFLLSLFRLIRPAAATKLSTEAQDTLADLRRDGIAVVPQFISPNEAAEIRGFLEGQQFEQISATKRQYAPETLLNCERVCLLLVDPFLRSIASAYLGSVPVFTGVTAWWSMSSSTTRKEDLSRAAQLFHFDYDWPAFVKFFIYLTDVSDDNGPFTYVTGTHEAKLEWRDGRIDDEYIHNCYGAKVRRITGRAGDLIIADTAGYHKGERVSGGPRLILQFEFAVSRLGASCQYDLLPEHKRPELVPAPTFDVFAK